MADEAGEKSLPASAQKRRRAREEGQVARSQDLTAAFALLGAMTALRYFGSGMLERVVAVTRYLFMHAAELVVNTATAQSIAGGILLQLGRVMLPFMVVMMIVGVVANLLQVGILFTGKPLVPKLDKINPFKGVRKPFQFAGVGQARQVDHHHLHGGVHRVADDARADERDSEYDVPDAAVAATGGGRAHLRGVVAVRVGAVCAGRAGLRVSVFSARIEDEDDGEGSQGRDESSSRATR